MKSMKTTLMENKWKVVLSSLLVMLPALSQWIMKGNVSLYPAALLATHWFCLGVTLLDHKNREQSPKALGLIFWLVPAGSMFFGMISVLMDNRGNKYAAVSALMYFGFGLIFLVCGNYFPKIKQNRTLGIKIKWALENEENWNATHRFGGKVWVLGGLLSMGCALFSEAAVTVIVFFFLVLLTAIVPCAYSYWFYRKQLAEGKLEKQRVKPRSVFLTMALVLGVTAFIIWTLFSGDMEIVYGEDSFTVEAVGWTDLTVNYADIESVEYQPQDPSAAGSGGRTNGFGNLKLSMGSFFNEFYGDYTRYTYESCDSCVVLTVNGETVVLNGPEDEATREIFETLAERWQE